MNQEPQLSDYRWLTGPDAAAWLDRLAQERRPGVAQIDRLRKELSVERTHLVVQQAELRQRATAKFRRAERMFFTPRSLEQATDQFVAEYKSRRFPQAQPTADLCCGIGGDLLALAAKGPVLAIDSDPTMTLLAEANLDALRLDRPEDQAYEVRVEDVSKFAPTDVAAWHIDPDRRPKGRRTTRVELHEPSSTVLQRLLGECPNAAIKLAPAADLAEAWLGEAELEWISRDRQCRQLVAWFGALANEPGERRATVLRVDQPDGMTTIRSLTGSPDVRPAVADSPGRYVFDPDAAVLAAKLTGTLAAEHGLAALAPNVAYLTGDDSIDDLALACFEVTDVLPFDLKRLKRLLSQREIGRLEIKKRAVGHDPADLRRRLRLRGPNRAVLLITPIANRVTAILAHRVVGGS